MVLTMPETASAFCGCVRVLIWAPRLVSPCDVISEIGPAKIMFIL